MGLLDVEQLRKQRYDEQKSGQKPQKTAPSQGQVRPKSDPEKSLQATPAMVYSESSQSCHKNALEAV